METEIKIEVADHAPIRTRLQELGATYVDSAEEENIYLDHDGELADRGESLRLRKDQRVRLTWKGPTTFHEGVVHRPEIEFTVSNFYATAQLFDRLGFQPADNLAKRRETWRLTGVEIALDTVSFGKFVELEGDPAIAQTLAHQLGLDLTNAIPFSYRRLQRERQALAGGPLPPDDSD